jgi:hypothetical protein
MRVRDGMALGRSTVRRARLRNHNRAMRHGGTSRRCCALQQDYRETLATRLDDKAGDGVPRGHGLRNIAR